MHSDETKEKAVVLYKSTGKVSETADLVGISYDTMRLWSHTDWFKDRTAELLLEERTALNRKLEVIVEEAGDAVLDRLRNGDVVFDQKTGEMQRKPIAAQVASQILQQGIEKQVLIQKLVREDQLVEGQEKLVDRLTRLALEFSKFSKNTPKIIDAEVVTTTNEVISDAVHDQRETGLLQGTEVGPQAPGKVDPPGS